MSQPPKTTSQRQTWPFFVSFLCLLLGIGLGFVAALPSRQPLSAAQLAKALNVHYWHFTVPPDDGSELAFELIDGEKSRWFCRIGGIASGELLLVTLRRLPDSEGKFECSILGQFFEHHEVIDAPSFSHLSTLQYLPNGEQVTDQPLLQSNRDGHVYSPFTKVREGDVLIRLAMKKKES